MNFLDAFGLIESTEEEYYEATNEWNAIASIRRLLKDIGAVQYRLLFIHDSNEWTNFRLGVKARRAKVKSSTYEIRVSGLDFLTFRLFIPYLNEKAVTSVPASLWPTLVRVLSQRCEGIPKPDALWLPGEERERKAKLEKEYGKLFFRLPTEQNYYLAELKAQQLKTEETRPPSGS
jgi:hypothetical protein